MRIKFASVIVLLFLAGCSFGSPTEAVDTQAEDEVVVDTPMYESAVNGWAVLAQKDNYDDVGMTNIPVDYIGITEMRQLLLDAGWQEDQIHEVRDFDQESLLGELDWLAENADQDDLVIVYIAAHGNYLRDVMQWSTFFAPEWNDILSQDRVLLVDSCQAANYTDAISSDPASYLAIAAVDGDEFGWSGLKEEGLPIIGGIFTHYFVRAFGDLQADVDRDGLVSIQEAAQLAETQQRTYMHDVVFGVPEFVESYHNIGVYPEIDPEFPDVIVDDTIGDPVFLELEHNTGQ